LEIDRSARLPVLDGLRGIAAVLVMLHHVSPYFGLPGLAQRGYLAVDFFFMLSGFVLTLAYEQRMGDGSAFRFLISRAARLWPLLCVGILISGAGQLALRHDAIAPPYVLLVICCSLLFVPLAGANLGIYQLDGPQWSITFELIANFVHARLLCKLNDRRLLAFALTCGCVLAALTQWFGDAGMGGTVTNWWGGFFRVGFGYALGVWFGRRYRPADRLELGRGWWLALAPLPAILLLTPLLPVGPATADCMAIFVLLPATLWLTARVALPNGAVAPMLALGRISYPLYAVHVPIFAVAELLAAGRQPGVQMAIRAIAVATIVIAAWALANSRLAKGLRLPTRLSFTAGAAKPLMAEAAPS
jgi:peptidoglycan/LPS O-acetylase OafA/YrhL